MSQTENATTTPSLDPGTLASLPSAIRQPAYDRKQVTPAIVHIGIGAFHRAHQAVYVDDTLVDDPTWGIIGVSLRSAATRDALAPQDNLYTVLTRGADGDRFRIVGSIVQTLVAPEDPGAVIARLGNPATRIVSLTVTEKGYCRDAAGRLDAKHPAIITDLANPAGPTSMPGVIVGGLARRRERGLAPFTVLSCDNLRRNGEITRGVLLAYAELADPSLARWLESNLVCPSTMVDRIVPKTAPNDRADVTRSCGYHDAWPVIAEPFGQWVMQDNFQLGRPDWSSSDISLVGDVGPWEDMKLRLLNGSHSALAYAGLLAGHDTVAGSFADPALKRFLTRLAVDELLFSLQPPQSVDLRTYLARLHERFANPAIRHTLEQIAADGSQKLPERLLPAARATIRSGRTPSAIAMVIAAWIRCWHLVASGHAKFALSDPLADDILAAAAPDKPVIAVRSVFALHAIFAEEDSALLAGSVAKALVAIGTHGIAAAVDTEVT